MRTDGGTDEGNRNLSQLCEGTSKQPLTPSTSAHSCVVLRGHADGQTEKRIRHISNYFFIIQIKHLHKCRQQIFREIVSGSGLQYIKCPDAHLKLYVYDSLSIAHQQMH
jgi:hypothetical protein